MTPDQQYLAAITASLRSNNPVGWPAYADDPAAVWRYIARSIGHGLTDPTTDLGHTYGSMVVVATFGTAAGVPVDNRTWISWINAAREETRS
jgi:hypothetical protein